MTEIVDGTAVEEPGTEVVAIDHGSSTLFHTNDPAEVVQRAARVADALRGVLDKQGLTARIGGKQHVLVEGWSTLGAMVGVTAVPVWTRPLDGDAPGGKTFGYEARVEARTLDGRVVGAAEALCNRTEGRWKTADDYAIKSMAQTRAVSKALRGPLGFVVTLAGYAATPAEEMPTDPAPAPGPAFGPEVPSGARAETLDAIAELLTITDEPADLEPSARDAAKRVAKALTLGAGGYMPDIVATALCTVRDAARARDTAHRDLPWHPDHDPSTVEVPA